MDRVCVRFVFVAAALLIMGAPGTTSTATSPSQHAVLGEASVWTAESHGGLVLKVDRQAGTYQVLLHGEVWLTSGASPAAIHCDHQWYSTRKGDTPLVLKTTKDSEGNDGRFGAYKALRLEWLAGTTEFETTFRVYKDTGSIVFQQTFPNGAQGTSLDDGNAVLSAFPLFAGDESSRISKLGRLSFSNLWSLGDMGTGLDGYFGGVAGGVPLAFFDPQGITSDVVILSPFANFKIGYLARMKHFNNGLAAGLGGRVISIPGNMVHHTILHVGQGMNQTFFEWGDLLLKRSGKQRTTSTSDVAIEKLGYWTDNGAYYYYLTEEDTNYEDTLIDIKKYTDSLHLPVHYMQIDSWWYFKGANHGVKLWDARPEIFPSGLHGMQRRLGLPIVAHNRYWSFDTDYQATYKFIVEKDNGLAIPQDPKFWGDLLVGAHTNWDLVVYEQDWLNVEYTSMNVTQNNVYTGRDWLMQMGEGASAAGITIQYCMPLPSDYLQSTEIPSVTQIRASDDYQPGRDQWRIGRSSMLAWALGLVPFKDTFWTTSVQEGNPYSKDEPNTQLQALVASMSSGPIGPGDKIGHTDAKLLMRTCDVTGRLLKPHKPATAIDRTYSNDAPKGEVWSTFNFHSSHRFYYVFAADLSESYTLVVEDLDADRHGSYLALYRGSDDPSDSKADKRVAWFDADHPLVLKTHASKSSRVPFRYYLISPRLASGWILLGELAKFVPLSEERIGNLRDDTKGLRFSLSGGAEEAVELALVRGGDGTGNKKIISVKCVLDHTGKREVVCDREKCAC